MATTPYPFVSGAVLTASQLNSTFNVPVNNQTDSYTLLASDGGKRVVMNKASATTITVNDSLFSAGDSVWIHNIGAGTCTITAGTATVNTQASLALGQWGGGQLYFTSGSTAIFFRGDSKQTLSVEFLLVGGGGGGGGNRGGGGGAGGFVTGSGIIGKTTYTVKVGAGGPGLGDEKNGSSGTASGFLGSASGGGGGARLGSPGSNGGSGGGSGDGVAATGVSGEGNNGGTGSSNGAGGGGGAGGVGANGVSTTAGNGGAASTNAYDGVSTSYSGGGGGGSNGGTAGTGGTNAGNGTNNSTTGGNATANRGGGGGGGGTSGGGGNGGSGRVIVRWLTADATGLSISVTGTTTNGTDGSYTWYSWTATGTLVVA